MTFSRQSTEKQPKMDLEMLFIQTDVNVEDEDVSNAYGVLAGGFSFN